MQDKTRPSFYIISGKTIDNDYTNQLLADLVNGGYVFQRVNGVYKNERETAFIVYEMEREKAIELMNKYRQESILFVDNERRATLIYNNGKTEYLGIFQAVPKRIAITKDAYTEKDGRYYICR